MRVLRMTERSADLRHQVCLLEILNPQGGASKKLGIIFRHSKHRVTFIAQPATINPRFVIMVCTDYHSWF
jgi:hypothetical protein